MEPNEKAAPQDVTESQLSAIVSKAVESAFGTRLTELEKAVKSLGEKKAGPSVGDFVTVRAPEDQVPDEKRKGLLLGQFVRCVATSKMFGGSLRDNAVKAYGESHPVTKALSSDVYGSGGALVPTEVSAELIELLRPASAVRRLNPVILPMDNGKLQVPKITGGATAAYVAEGANISPSSPTTGDLNLSAKKLAAVVALSNDLIRRASVAADMVFRDDAVAAIAQRSDLAFIRGDGASNTPMGLRYWAPSGNVTATAGTTLAQVTTDLQKLINFLESGNVRMIRPGFLMAPRSKNYLMFLRDGNGNLAFPEMKDGNLLGYPFAATTQIPTNLSTNQSELYFADFADVVIAETTQVILDASGEAAYYDGIAVQAAFSKDQTVIRAIVEHDLGMRHDASVAVITGVTYGA